MYVIQCPVVRIVSASHFCNYRPYELCLSSQEYKLWQRFNGPLLHYNLIGLESLHSHPQSIIRRELYSVIL